MKRMINTMGTYLIFSDFYYVKNVTKDYINVFTADSKNQFLLSF